MVTTGHFITLKAMILTQEYESQAVFEEAIDATVVYVHCKYLNWWFLEKREKKGSRKIHLHQSLLVKHFCWDTWHKKVRFFIIDLLSHRTIGFLFLAYVILHQHYLKQGFVRLKDKEIVGHGAKAPDIIIPRKVVHGWSKRELWAQVVDFFLKKKTNIIHKAMTTARFNIHHDKGRH